MVRVIRIHNAAGLLLQVIEDDDDTRTHTERDAAGTVTLQRPYTPAENDVADTPPPVAPEVRIAELEAQVSALDAQLDELMIGGLS